MNRFTRYFTVAACIAWPAVTFAQNQPTPSREDAEPNAFQAPSTGNAGGGGQPERGSSRGGQSPSSSQQPSTNPEAQNITEPTGRPSKPSPGGGDK